MAKQLKIKETTTNASPKGAKAKPKAPAPQEATEAPKGKGKLTKPQEAPKGAKEAKPQRPKLADVPKTERTTEKLRTLFGARVVCRWQNDGIDYPGMIIAPMAHHHLDGQPAPTIPENHVRVFFRAFPEYGWPTETWADIRTENIRAPGESFEETPKATTEQPEQPKGRKLAKPKGSDANEKHGKLAKKAARKPPTRKR